MNETLDRISQGRRLWILFYEFARISTLVIGGGLVIIGAVEEVFVRRRGWITEDEFADMVGLTQTIPGVFAGNSAVYVGLKSAGFWGALTALLGTVIPPYIVISLIASGLAAAPPDNEYLRGVFLGVNSCVVGMIGAVAVRMGRKMLKGWFEIILVAAAFCGMAFAKWNPGWVILGAVALGLAYTWRLQRKVCR